MSNLTRLMVLGAVHQFQPVHGYFLRQELITWHVDEWANVNPGSIYNALSSLKKDGYVEEHCIETQGKRPERTVYKMTPEGNVEFIRLLRKVIWSVDAFDTKSGMVLTSFMFALSRQEVVEVLEHRVREIDARVKANGYHVEDVAQSETTPLYVREIFELSTMRLKGEKEWTEALLQRLHNGEYSFAGEAPSKRGRHQP